MPDEFARTGAPANRNAPTANSLGVDETRASYHVCVPLEGWLRSRHRGEESTATPGLALIYRPDGETTVIRWPAGSRHLAVKIDQCAVDRAPEALLGSGPESPIAFDGALSLHAGAAKGWVRLALMGIVNESGDSLMLHPLVWDPLVESLIHRLLMVADYPYSQAFAAPTQPGPTVVRNAMDLIEAGPHLPLTTSTLAKQCHVREHTGGISSAPGHVTDGLSTRGQTPLCSSGSALGKFLPQQRRLDRHRWGFTHLGRFAAAYQTMFAETPLQALRTTR